MPYILSMHSVSNRVKRKIESIAILNAYLQTKKRLGLSTVMAWISAVIRRVASDKESSCEC